MLIKLIQIGVFISGFAFAWKLTEPLDKYLRTMLRKKIKDE